MGILTIFIIRSNNEISGNTGNACQYGGAIIISCQKNEKLTYKYGLYFNREFFGNFFMPLAGIDWRINAKNNLFGVLPGNMTYEHKVSSLFYYGATFRAVTNSYKLPVFDPCSSDSSMQKYMRIDDNQLAVFIDCYLAKHVVINMEAGHSLFRKMSMGMKGDTTPLSKTILTSQDNLFVKAALAYRLRL
jgi:hypothetical protein